MYHNVFLWEESCRKGEILRKILLYVLPILVLGGVAGFPLAGQETSRAVSGKKPRSVSRKTGYTVPEGSIRVSGALLNAPAIGSVSRSKRSSARFADRWLQVDIQFSFQFPSSIRDKTMYFLNRPSVELYMVNFLPGRRWFYGVQKLHSILLDSRYKTKKYSVSLFLPPNYVHAYLPKNKSDKVDPKSLEGVVVIRDNAGVVLGCKAFSFRQGLTKRDSAALLRQWQSRLAQGDIPEMFFPREKTPWQWVDSEYYELPATELPGKSTAGKTGYGEE